MTYKEAEEQGLCTCDCHYKSNHENGNEIMHFMACCDRTYEPL